MNTGEFLKRNRTVLLPIEEEDNNAFGEREKKRKLDPFQNQEDLEKDGQYKTRKS